MEEAIIGGQWSPPTSLARHGLVEGKFPSSEGKFPSRRENGYPLWQGSKIDLGREAGLSSNKITYEDILKIRYKRY